MNQSNHKVKAVFAFLGLFLLVFVSSLIGILVGDFFSPPSNGPEFMPVGIIMAIPLSLIFPFMILPSLGLKKYKKILFEDISKKRKLIGEGYIVTSALPEGKKFSKESILGGLLFFTEAGIEYYTGPYAIKNKNFYIPWNEIKFISITKEYVLTVGLYEERKHVFPFGDKNDWFYFKENAYKAIKDQLETCNSTQYNDISNS